MGESEMVSTPNTVPKGLVRRTIATIQRDTLVEWSGVVHSGNHLSWLKVGTIPFGLLISFAQIQGVNWGSYGTCTI